MLEILKYILLNIYTLNKKAEKCAKLVFKYIDFNIF